jgi:serine/threonine protein kinase/tetratricopeptide (TPR) repeat protein
MVLALTDLEETAPKRKLCIACKQEFSGDEITCPNDGTTLTHLTMEASIGSTIGEKYEILAVIGGGAMGLVYKARHTLMKRVVAIKMLHPNMLPDAGTVMRFKKEAEALSCLNHPGILTVFDFGISTQGQPYLVTDYLEGQTLGELLESTQVVPWQRTVNIFMQVCSALAHAHKNGVIHRDIKPSNIMLTEFEDQQDVVKILDFGIAKVITEETENSSQLTRTGEVFGSPLYMSPEQCRGKSLDARSDIYSLGCVMFRTLTGQPAFFGQDLVECLYKHVNEAAPSLREMTPEANIPEALEQVVLKCLAKDQNDRYQTMVELKEALANSVGITSATSTSIEAVQKPSGQTMVNTAIQEMYAGGTPKANLGATGSSALEPTNPDPKVLPPPVLQSPDEPRRPIDGANLETTVLSAKPGLLQDKRALIAGGLLLALVVGVPVFTSMSKGGDKGTTPVDTATAPTSGTPDTTPAKPETFEDKLERGIDEYELGDYDESQELIGDAIRQGRKENVGPDKIAEALHYMVNASIGANEDTEAEAFVSQLEHDAKVDGKGGPPTTMAQADAYLDRSALLMTHNSDSDDDRAKQLLTEALGYFKTQKNAGNEIMRAQSRLGLLELANGNFAGAEDWMKKAVALAESDRSVRQLDLALRMDQLGDAYVLLAGSMKGGSKYYSSAENMYLRALQLRITSVKSKTHPALAQSYQRIGIMYYLKDDYNEALKKLNKALEIRQKQGKPLQIAQVQRSIAYVYLQQKNFAKADATFRQAIATAKKSDVDTSLKITEWQRGYDGLKSRVKRHR